MTPEHGTAEHDGTVRQRLATMLLAFPLVATILIATIRGSRHLAWEWPTHAQHHLVAHMSVAVGLAVVGLLLVFVPLRRGERWAWWGIAVVGLATFGGYWLGNATVGLGIEAVLPNTAQAALALLYTAGLVLAVGQTTPNVTSQRSGAVTAAAVARR